MSEQHYFSETPETEFKPRPVQVELAGRKVTVTTANGIFSPSGIDKGTAILLQEAPDPQGERMLDIGCGWGPITLTLAMLAPDAQVHAVDVNSRSISLTERNAAALGLPNVTVGTPESADPQPRFDHPSRRFAGRRPDAVSDPAKLAGCRTNPSYLYPRLTFPFSDDPDP